eukprot:6213350-Pleurochrysis_carterae.AAC.2
MHKAHRPYGLHVIRLCTRAPYSPHFCTSCARVRVGVRISQLMTERTAWERMTVCVRTCANGSIARARYARAQSSAACAVYTSRGEIGGSAAS